MASTVHFFPRGDNKERSTFILNLWGHDEEWDMPSVPEEVVLGRGRDTSATPILGGSTEPIDQQSTACHRRLGSQRTADALRTQHQSMPDVTDGGVGMFLQHGRHTSVMPIQGRLGSLQTADALRTQHQVRPAVKDGGGNMPVGIDGAGPSARDEPGPSPTACRRSRSLCALSGGGTHRDGIPMEPRPSRGITAPRATSDPARGSTHSERSKSKRG
mmetsp:Transcript_94419/g.276075  ORF Transcript_94419/g.276075 Transcript_94419/m.276075 type:complete len:216 (-) Transcript_94419:51-698(-)